MTTFAIPFNERGWRSATKAGFFSAKLKARSLKRLFRKVQASTEKQ